MSERCFTLQELAQKTGSVLIGEPTYAIWGVADLERAGAEEISFFGNPKYHKQMLSSKAGALIMPPGIEYPKNKNILITEDPTRTFQDIIELFQEFIQESTAFSGIHPTAVIHHKATIAQDVVIGPYAVIDAHVCIGRKSFIGAHCYVGPHVTVGADCFFHPHVTVRESCQIGNRVILQPGVVIGSCGYGYTTDKEGKHQKLNQIGIVIIEDDVEIGANTTIDRARFKATHIKEGTKIDNLVQIAHGVVIGKHNFIIAQAGIAGSSSTGDHVILAGKVAVNGHIKIGDRVIIGACSGVSKSITKPGKYAGVPVMPLAENNKNQVLLRSIDKYIKELKELKEQVALLLEQK